MDSFVSQQSNISFNIPPVTNPPPHQYFGSNEQEASSMQEDFPAEAVFGDSDDHRGSIEDGNDAKRRRIARVRALIPSARISTYKDSVGL